MDADAVAIIVEPIATNLWWVLIVCIGIVFLLGTIFGRWTKRDSK